MPSVVSWPKQGLVAFTRRTSVAFVILLLLALAAPGFRAERSSSMSSLDATGEGIETLLKVQLGLGHASSLERVTWDSRLLHKDGPLDTHFMYQGELLGRYQEVLNDGPDVLDDWRPIMQRVASGLWRWGPGGSERDDPMTREEFAGDLLFDIECFPVAIDDPDQAERCARIVSEHYQGRWKDARRDYNGAVVQFFAEMFRVAEQLYPNARLGIYNGFRILRSDAHDERIDAVRRYHDSLAPLLQLCDFYAPSFGYVMPEGSPIGQTIDNIPFQFAEVQRTLAEAGVSDREITPITSPLYAAESDFSRRIGRPEWDRLLRAVVFECHCLRPIVWMAAGEDLRPYQVQLIIDRDVQPAIIALGRN